jgi:tRNA(Ile)-lysidine synthase
MPPAARFGKGWLLRPLLSVERAEILAYAESHDLCWVEDATNADRSIDRNFIRHEIMPLFKARWPAVGRSLGRSARWCAETARLVDVLADRDLKRASVGRTDRLNIQVLRSLDEARRRNTLRRWFRRSGLPSPNAVHLDHIVHDAIFASHDRAPVIHWPGAEVRRYRNLLYAMPPLPAHDAGAVISIQAPAGDPHLISRHEGRGDFDQGVFIPGIGRLSLVGSHGHGIRAAALAGAALTARFRQGGERSRPAGRRHSQNLKKLLQAAGVPPWERERLPLLYVDESLAAVADLWVEAGFSAGKNEPGMVWEWQKASPFDNV